MKTLLMFECSFMIACFSLMEQISLNHPYSLDHYTYSHFNQYPHYHLHHYPQYPLHHYPQYPLHHYPQYPLHHYTKYPIHNYYQYPLYNYSLHHYPQYPLHNYSLHHYPHYRISHHSKYTLPHDRKYSLPHRRQVRKKQCLTHPFYRNKPCLTLSNISSASCILSEIRYDGEPICQSLIGGTCELTGNDGWRPICDDHCRLSDGIRYCYDWLPRMWGWWKAIWG